MSDPARSGSDGPDEWIEVVNVGTTSLSTAGWRISDAKASDDIPVVEVPSGGYLVIAGKSAELPSTIRVVRVADGTIGNGLNNNGDVIALVNPAGETVDAISYGDNTDIFEPPPPAPDSGKTLGSRAPGADEVAENWELTLVPSPGESNSFEEPVEPESDDEVSDAEGVEGPRQEATDGRTLVPSERHGPALSTLDWILLAVTLMAVGAVAASAVRRYGEPAWKRIRRGH